MPVHLVPPVQRSHPHRDLQQSNVYLKNDEYPPLGKLYQHSGLFSRIFGLELGALKMKDHVQTVHMNNFIIDEIIYVH